MGLSLANAAIPTPVPVQPMQPIQLTDRSQRISFFDPNYTAPYVQNLTLSVTRSLQPNLTLDLRYIGTLARKQFTSFDLNLPNFLYNGLGAEFDTIRAGGDQTGLTWVLYNVVIQYR